MLQNYAALFRLLTQSTRRALQGPCWPAAHQSPVPCTVRSPRHPVHLLSSSALPNSPHLQLHLLERTCFPCETSGFRPARVDRPVYKKQVPLCSVISHSRLISKATTFRRDFPKSPQLDVGTSPDTLIPHIQLMGNLRSPSMPCTTCIASPDLPPACWRPRVAGAPEVGPTDTLSATHTLLKPPNCE